MKKIFSSKLVFISFALLTLSCISIAYAQSINNAPNTALEPISTAEHVAIPQKMADKIAFFEQEHAKFVQTGNTAAADYCLKTLERLKSK
jgi:hypothetical protein